MADRYFPAVDRWLVPRPALEASRQEMAQDGRLGNEGTALWFGMRQDGAANVRSVILLRGAGIDKSKGFISISPELINDVTDLADARGEVLIAQIHSHPFGNRLSPIDEAGGFRVQGFLSVVVPDYSQAPELDLATCGAYVFEDFWRRLSREEAAERIEVLGELPVEVLTVGE